MGRFPATPASPRRSLPALALAWALLATVMAHADVGTTPPAPGFLGLEPGRADRNDVRRVLGGAPEVPAPGLEDYPPPAQTPDIARVRVAYFPDSGRVARIEPRLRAPLPLDLFRGQFGTPSLTRPHPDGGREELYDGRRQALLVGVGGQVSAVAFLSPRALADAHVEAGLRLRGRGESEAAGREARAAIAVAPDYAAGHVLAGRVELAARRNDAAAAEFGRGAEATAAPAAQAVAIAEAALLRATRKAEAARQGVARALALAPGSAEVQVLHGRLLRRLKQPEAEAAAAFRRALDLKPDDPEALAEMGGLAFDGKRWQEALPWLRRVADWADGEAALLYDPAFRVRAHFRLAYALVRIGAPPEESIRAYGKVLAIDPGNADALNNIGDRYEKAGRLDEAEAAFRKCVGIDAGDVLCRRNLAEVLLARGQLGEARGALEAAHGLKPDDARVRYALARVHAAGNDKEAALDWLDKAVAAGYRDHARAAAEAEFRALADDARFRALLERMR